jgi:hypothetical protein
VHMLRRALHMPRALKALPTPLSLSTFLLNSYADTIEALYIENLAVPRFCNNKELSITINYSVAGVNDQSQRHLSKGS